MPAGAQQACTQADIAGDWDLYLAAGVDDDDDDDDDILDDSDGWSACRVTVETQGEVSGPCVTDERSSFSIDGGELAVRNNCQIRGSFVLRDGNQTATLTVRRATLAPSGDLIAGGTQGPGDDDDDDDFAALFQMVRR
jgi:hypothetical protein